MRCILITFCFIDPGIIAAIVIALIVSIIVFITVYCKVYLRFERLKAELGYVHFKANPGTIQFGKICFNSPILTHSWLYTKCFSGSENQQKDNFGFLSPFTGNPLSYFSKKRQSGNIMENGGTLELFKQIELEKNSPPGWQKKDPS